MLKIMRGIFLVAMVTDNLKIFKLSFKKAENCVLLFFYW